MKKKEKATETFKLDLSSTKIMNFVDFNKYTKKSGGSLKTRFREFNRYHGLPKQDAVFFNMSDLICNLAKQKTVLLWDAAQI